MQVTINGNRKILQHEISVMDFLVQHQVKMPEMVSVQINGELVDRDMFDATVIQENDTVDFLYFMGEGPD